MKIIKNNKLINFKNNKTNLKIKQLAKLSLIFLINGLEDEPETYGQYIGKTGVLVSQTGYNCSGFIEIPKNVTKLYHFDGGAYIAGAIYDENKELLKLIYATTVTDVPEGGLSMNDPYWDIEPNMKYIRVNSGHKQNLLSIYYYGTENKNEIFEHESNKTYSILSVEIMKNSDLKTGDVVTTNCYSKAGDNGNATYDIMTYKEWWYKLPGDIKFTYSNNSYVKTPVDEYGNHTLNNGLIARLRLDGEIRPEQWGAIGNGVNNDIWPFIHLAAQIKTGNIVCGKDKTYILDLMNDDYGADNPYRVVMCGSLLGGQPFGKPIFNNTNGLKFNGNGSTFTYLPDRFGNIGMGMINFSGDMIDTEIYNCKFDAKGYSMSTNNKNSNHILFYAPGGVNFTNEIKVYHPNMDKDTGLKRTSIFKNVNIHDNEFGDCGAMYRKAGDWGGDHILIINPDYLNGLTIEHNKFHNWGRWVFAIDLGGNGERLTNIKFNYNECLGANSFLEKDADDNYIFLTEGPEEKLREMNKYTEAGIKYQVNNWRWRGLGFIDFEAKKCFSGIELIGNTIIGSSGWAINGASRVTRDVLIKDNSWAHCGGGYPYTIEFYSGEAENWRFENNDFISCGGMRLGYVSKDIYIIGNVGQQLSFRMQGMHGNIVFENNKLRENATAGYYKMLSLEGNNLFNGITPETQYVNFVCKNNEFGITGGLYWNYPHIHFDTSGNSINYIDIANFYGETFDANQLVDTNGAHNLHGLKSRTPITKAITNKLTPGNYWEEGQIIYDTIKNLTYFNGIIYHSNEYNDVENFEKGGSNFNFKVYADNMGWEEGEMVCTRSGIIPPIGAWGFRGGFSPYELFGNSYTKVQDGGAYIYTKDNVYLATNIGEGGLLGDIEPTHVSGEALCGEVTLKWVAPMGRYTLREKKTRVAKLNISNKNIVLTPDSKEFTINVTAYDENNNIIDNPNLEWICEDESIISLKTENNNCLITGIKDGYTNITCSSGGITTSCSVIYNDDSIELSENLYNVYNLYEIEKFHRKGITGKGIKIGLYDENCIAATNEQYMYSIINNTSCNTIGDHATEVASVIKSKTFGLAPDSECYNIVGNSSITDASDGSTANALRVIDAIYQAIDMNLNILCITLGLNLMNSTITNETTQNLREAFKNAQESGLIVVISAGNNLNSMLLEWPQSAIDSDNFIMVRGCEDNGHYVNSGTETPFATIASYYNHTQLYNSNFKVLTNLSGTSFSAPTVCAIISLILQQNSNFTVKELINYLKSTAIKIADDRVSVDLVIPTFVTDNYEKEDETIIEEQIDIESATIDIKEANWDSVNNRYEYTMDPNSSIELIHTLYPQNTTDYLRWCIGNKALFTRSTEGRNIIHSNNFSGLGWNVITGYDRHNKAIVSIKLSIKK